MGFSVVLEKKSTELREVLRDSFRFCEILLSAMRFSKMLKVSQKCFKFLPSSTSV